MLHNVLRTLGRSSHPTKRSGRRKSSPNARRPDAAIERLEERMLLSGTNDGESDSTTVAAPENHRPSGGSQLIYWAICDGAPVAFSTFLTGFDPDGDALRFEIVSPPAIGSVQIDEDFVAADRYIASCELSFQAPDGWRGSTTFTYRIFDGTEYSDVDTAVIYIETDHPPKLEDQTSKGTQDQPVVGTLQWHDPDNDRLFVNVEEPPAVGKLVFADATSGDFVYTPPKGFAGTVSFTYSVRSPWGAYSQTATVTIVIEPGAEPTHEKPRDGKPRHEKPHQGEAHHEKPSHHPRTPVHSQPVASDGDSPRDSASNAQAKTGKHVDKQGKGKSLAGSEFIQATTIIVPPTFVTEEAQPAKVTSVIYATDELKVSRSLAHSLRLTRFDEDGQDGADVAKAVSFEFRDVNGDGREDLIAVFELDWAELWDGQESAVLTGRLV